MNILKNSVILELDALTNTDKTFLVESLLLWIHHYRLASPGGRREQFDHAIILEEAHHIIGKTKSDLVGGEAITDVIGWDSRLGTRLIAAIAIGALFWFAWAGADVATRLQFVIMTLLVAALLSFFIGAIPAFDGATLSRSWTAAAGSIGFWSAFAIFFPAVTGFTQGVSMSGDLDDASKSLPRGTFAAVGVSTVVYGAVAILLAGGVPLFVLQNDSGEAMRNLAWIGALVGIGVIAATLSSAMASLRIDHYSVYNQRVNFPFPPRSSFTTCLINGIFILKHDTFAMMLP